MNGLVLSPGAVPGPAKLVHGARKTLEGVADVFSGALWPTLAGWEGAPDAQGSCLLLSPYVRTSMHRASPAPARHPSGR